MSFPNGKSLDRVALIGVGQVGTAAAFALILNSVADEILIVDIKARLRDSQVQDLSDVSSCCNSRTRVRAATYREASQCDIVVITAGSYCPIGETSIQHMYQKVSLVRSIINAMKPFQSDAVLLLVANPVDLLTSVAHRISGLPSRQVVGSGTFLDSVRIRQLLAEKSGAVTNLIHLNIVGVNGDKEVVAWSDATIDGVAIDESIQLSNADRNELSTECKRRTQGVINMRGKTPLGIGSVILSICSSILADKRDINPISHFHPEWGCCFSLPAMLGREGILDTIHTPLNRDEGDSFFRSVTALKATIDCVDEAV